MYVDNSKCYVAAVRRSDTSTASLTLRIPLVTTIRRCLEDTTSSLRALWCTTALHDVQARLGEVNRCSLFRTQLIYMINKQQQQQVNALLLCLSHALSRSSAAAAGMLCDALVFPTTKSSHKRHIIHTRSALVDTHLVLFKALLCVCLLCLSHAVRSAVCDAKISSSVMHRCHLCRASSVCICFHCVALTCV
jgi:hypothetical protein